MKKTALIVGGSGGLGLAIGMGLEDVGRLDIVDIQAPVMDIEGKDVHYHHFDLSSGDYSLFDTLPVPDYLVITAGIGRLRLFKDDSDADIDRIFAINAVAPVKIIRHFYGALASDRRIDCAVISSIAGHVTSPFFATYGATKAALRSFIETVNVELDRDGSSNRILEVAPFSLKGTGFNGGGTDLSQLRDTVAKIIAAMKARDELLIPADPAVTADVLGRYAADHHAFGLQSYEYKLKSGRVK